MEWILTTQEFLDVIVKWYKLKEEKTTTQRFNGTNAFLKYAFTKVKCGTGKH